MNQRMNENKHTVQTPSLQEAKNIKEFVAYSVIKHLSKYDKLVDFFKDYTGKNLEECHNMDIDPECFGWTLSRQDNCSICKKNFCHLCVDKFLLRYSSSVNYGGTCVFCIDKIETPDKSCYDCSSMDVKIIKLPMNYYDTFCHYCNKCKRILTRK